jgi:hypothetical protein
LDLAINSLLEWTLIHFTEEETPMAQLLSPVQFIIRFFGGNVSPAETALEASTRSKSVHLS